MPAIPPTLLAIGGVFVLWVGIGYAVATLRCTRWLLLLWSFFFLIGGFQMITQAFGLWTDQHVLWLILNAFALICVLIFTLERGWQILRDQRIGLWQVLFFRYK